MLTKTVKISNVTNLSDARYCAGMGVEMLGFSIDETSAQYISPKKFEDICSWLAGVNLIAETSLEQPDAIIKALESYPVHMIQVASPGLLNYLRSELSLPLILRVNIDNYEPYELEMLLGRHENEAAYFLLESDANQELSPDWRQAIQKIASEYPLLVGFGLDDEDVVNALVAAIPQAGIALRGSEEIRPGFKDFGAMMDILEALEEQ